ncbi:polyprenyl synthetase family protein [Pendulispora albinea]|uniref:Polyprenyl synthetase family protein n=1 Tax=Pendulispora albinea TaxID=2741071 RepID=A0ABZ2MAE7_9BACT
MIPTAKDDPRRAFADLAGRVRQRVDAELEACLDAMLDRARRYGAPVAETVGALRALALRGGKRFRPTLLAASYEACGGAGGADAVVMAGVALELLQAYLLTHDDWMDGDDIRRGGPSVHAALRQAFGSPHMGATSAVLAGDLAMGFAQRVLLGLRFPPERLVDASVEFARMQIDVVFGQLLDVHAEASDAAAVEQVHDLKTSSYTVRGPVLLGAVLAGAPTATRSALERFADPLGIAFQLRDDLLGTFGDPAATGKPSDGDLRKGKRTALVVELLTDPGARALLDRVLGHEDADPADVDRVVSRMVESGARARVEARLAALLNEATTALDATPLDPAARLSLHGAVLALGVREH